MVELDQFKYTLSTYEKPLLEVHAALNLDAKMKKIDELDRTMEEPSFWEDADRAAKMVKEAKGLKDTVEGFNKLQNQYEELGLLIEMGYEENDPEIIPEIQEMMDEFISEFEALRLRTLLTGEYDSNNAILKLSAGAGGTEACDWCSMLYRMYCRWAERKGFSVEVLDFQDGDEA
ncbi:MAG: PCRF domain-containing protein, partial [Lachnospiraceae bacterium]|nr:PCRF domain-containing protein [Lachnospiraceae bacterium]